MLGPRRPLADSSDVLSDINRQIAYMVRIPRILLMYCAGFGKRWEFAAKKKANSQQRHRDSHSPLPSRMSCENHIKLLGAGRTEIGGPGVRSTSASSGIEAFRNTELLEAFSQGAAGIESRRKG
jgi:hypothetical protein